MIDIHSHIIFEVDDGPPSIKESIRMVLEAERYGVKDIIATPHYNEQLYHGSNTNENFSTLKSRLSDCDIRLHLGHEVAMSPNMIQNIKELKGKTLCNSRYILFELPFDHIPVYSSELLYVLNVEKMIPILAHPERNRVLVKNFDAFIKFLENGCLVQMDAASIIGVYGSDARIFSEKVIKLHLAHFVASDAHHADDYTNWYLPALKQVIKWAGEKYTTQLFNDNAQKILTNKT